MHQRWWRLFALAWLALMVFPFAGLLSSRHSAVYTAAGLLGGASFCAVYAWAWLRQRGWCEGLAPAVSVISLTALSLALSIADGPTWGSTLIYCTVVAGAMLDWRKALALTGLYAVSAALLAAGYGLGGGFALGAVLEIVLSGVGMVGIFRLVQANYALRQAREEVSRLAVTEERLRFARDLHDLLGHSLSVIVLKAELASRLSATDPGRASAEMGDVESVARQALTEVREAVAGYRQSSLSSELTSVRQMLNAAGIEARIEQASGPLPATEEAILAWAVREGVTNVVRHSRARHCTISVSRDDAGARLEIADDGVGAPDPERAGSGLRGLRERVEAHAGRLEAGPGPGRGFRLLVSLPSA